MIHRASAVRRNLLIHSILGTILFTGVPACAQMVGASRGEAQITAVQHQTARDYIRVVVHLDRPARFVDGAALDPYRIFFDLQGTRPADTLASRIAVDDPILRGIRVGQYQPGITRVVLDVDRPAPYTASFISYPPRLVIEISRAVVSAQTRAVAAPILTPTPIPRPTLPPTTTANPQLVAPLVSPPSILPSNKGKESESAVTSTPSSGSPAATAAPTTPVLPFETRSIPALGAAVSGDPKVVQQAAQAGNVNAQFQLGDLYMNGRGVDRNASEAARWYTYAAQQGHALAASNLGVLYANGWGVPKSDAEAVNWFRKAAEAGEGGAQNNLGAMYLAGRGVPQSDALGAKWVYAAAQQGVREAEYALGTMYANGRGVPADNAQTFKWLQAAATQNYAPAQLVLGELYVAGSAVPRDYSAALKLFQGADVPEAWYQIGLLYQRGWGVPPSEAEAVVWFLKAADRSVPQAQFALGRIYQNRDPVGAYAWFALAAASGEKQGSAAMSDLARRMTAQQLSEAQQLALALAARPNK